MLKDENMKMILVQTPSYSALHIDHMHQVGKKNLRLFSEA